MTRVRPAAPTVAFIDQYCARSRGLVHNVRHVEQFTAWHLGAWDYWRRHDTSRCRGWARRCTPTRRRCTTSWPMPSQCRANAEWSVKELRAERLDLLRQAVGDTPFILCIDETGDRKNGHTTDYSVATDSVATDSVATQSVHR